MLRIGEFSALSQIPVKTLRYYDDIGLLPPAFIDMQTGYRYYETVQLTRLFRIRAFKELGFSLEDIALLLQPDLSEAERARIIARRREEQDRQVQREQRRLKHLQQLALTMEMESPLLPQEEASIFFKSIPVLRVAAWRAPALCQTDVQLEQEITARFLALSAFLQTHRIRMIGNGILLWHDAEWQEETTDTEIAIPIAVSDDSDIPPHAMMRILDLPPVSLAACITYQGSAQGGQAQAAYVALADGLQAQNFQLLGPRREVTLHYDFVTGDRKVEVQFPVTLQPT